MLPSDRAQNLATRFKRFALKFFEAQARTYRFSKSGHRFIEFSTTHSRTCMLGSAVLVSLEKHLFPRKNTKIEELIKTSVVCRHRPDSTGSNKYMGVRLMFPCALLAMHAFAKFWCRILWRRSLRTTAFRATLPAFTLQRSNHVKMVTSNYGVQSNSSGFHASEQLIRMRHCLRITWRWWLPTRAFRATLLAFMLQSKSSECATACESPNLLSSLRHRTSFAQA